MLIPVILSGGSGTRLWPVSREGCPKPFMTLADGESLLFKTCKRAIEVAAAFNAVDTELVIVTNRDHYFMTRDALSLAGIDQSISVTFLLEPEGRNTAAAVALATHHVRARYGLDAMLLVMPADHVIQDQPAFITAVGNAMRLAGDDFLATFGIVPTTPETGFGYLEAGDMLGAGRRVLRFVEKPARAVAEDYVRSGNFFWNAGMFCFRTDVMLDELAVHARELSDAAEACWQAVSLGSSPAMIELPFPAFSRLPDISIDCALMERSKRVAVVPADIGWSDIGSWTAVGALIAPDENNNRVIGDAMLVDSRDNFVQADGRLIALLGISNVIVIDTPDALLIVQPDAAQNVREVVARLRQQHHGAHKWHRRVTRPWGTYTVLEESAGYKIKRIEVRPGASLSLQHHRHRSEHWIVVQGVASVVNGDQEMLVSANESTYIPAGNLHRLGNAGPDMLVMIEVQAGSYLGEDDIVRIEDRYGRV